MRNYVRYGWMTGVLLAASPAYANTLVKPDTTKPVLLEANAVSYDSHAEEVVATGRVEVTQGNYILQADTLTYYLNDNKVKASGKVVLLEPNGNVIFADNVTLNNDLKDGVIQQFKAKLADKSTFAAQEATRTNAQRVDMKNAVYSPCPVCEDNRGKTSDPLWQIKAKHITVDEPAQQVSYKDAWMELYGVPVFYTPYFFHPTPNADAKTGLLVPEYSHSSQLGTTFKAPVYINIAPNQDATITPFLTSSEGLVMNGEYRYRTNKGSYQFNGSITNPQRRDANGNVTDGHEMRGHIFAKGNSIINDQWAWGFDVNRSSDDTYLRRYEYGNYDLLTSQAYADRIEGRNIARIQTVMFQGLELTDNPDNEPYIFPSVDAHFESNPQKKFFNARTYADINSVVLQRRVGTDSRRISSTMGVKVPLATNNGQLLDVDASIRGDAYSVSDVVLNNGDTFTGEVQRTMPKLSLTWRYPLIKALNENSSLLVEPTAMLIARSNGNNSDKIPNEDSLTQDFSDTNLFSDERFAGLDRTEDGTHGIYGVRSRLQLPDDANISAMLGQDVRIDGDTNYPLADDTSHDISDVVGRLAGHYKAVDVSYRFRADEASGQLKRSELSAAVDLHPLTLQTDYISLDDDSTLDTREEVIASGALALNEQWSLHAFGHDDLDKNRMIDAGGGFTFTHDCITIYTQVRREFIRDRDIEPNTSVSLRVGLKNLN
jgi:LPS-assembly protein